MRGARSAQAVALDPVIDVPPELKTDLDVL
jgi:hypothetical protein